MAGDDACVSVWDLQNLCCMRMLSVVDMPVLSLALSKDGRHLALAMDDSNVAIYDVFTGVPGRSLPQKALQLFPVHCQQNTSCGVACAA